VYCCIQKFLSVPPPYPPHFIAKYYCVQDEHEYYDKTEKAYRGAKAKLLKLAEKEKSYKEKAEKKIAKLELALKQSDEQNDKNANKACRVLGLLGSGTPWIDAMPMETRYIDEIPSRCGWRVPLSWPHLTSNPSIHPTADKKAPGAETKDGDLGKEARGNVRQGGQNRRGQGQVYPRETPKGSGRLCMCRHPGRKSCGTCSQFPWCWAALTSPLTPGHRSRHTHALFPRRRKIPPSPSRLACSHRCAICFIAWRSAVQLIPCPC
jgi:hypothetical protein